MTAEAGELARAIVRLLRDVASGAVASDEAMRVLGAREKEMPDDKLFADAWPVIDHFGADSDIRSKEPDYDLRQRADLLRLADEIEQKYGVGGHGKQ